MTTSRFELNEMHGRIVAEASSASFTCEIAVDTSQEKKQIVAIVSFGKLKKETAAVFPVIVYWKNLQNLAREICDFYESRKASIWSDLYKEKGRNVSRRDGTG